MSKNAENCETLGVVFTFLSMFVFTTGSSRYDIEAEAIKLYREDLNTVVHNFRRTPEYLTLLQKKHDSNYLFLDLTDKLERAVSEDIRVFGERVAELYPVTKATKKPENNDDETTTAGDNRKMGSTNSTQKFRRDDGSEKMTRVERLDSYSQRLTGVFTIQQRNEIRDRCFKIVGTAIQAVMKGFGPDDDDSGMSTKYPNDDDVAHSTKNQEENAESLKENCSSDTTTAGNRYKHKKLRSKHKNKV